MCNGMRNGALIRIIESGMVIDRWKQVKVENVTYIDMRLSLTAFIILLRLSGSVPSSTPRRPFLAFSLSASLPSVTVNNVASLP